MVQTVSKIRGSVPLKTGHTRKEGGRVEKRKKKTVDRGTPEASQQVKKKTAKAGPRSQPRLSMKRLISKHGRENGGEIRETPQSQSHVFELTYETELYRQIKREDGRKTAG